MKLLHISFLVIAASMVASAGYSQVSVHARVGIGVPPPVVYESPYPAPRGPFYQKSPVIVVEPGYDHRYSRRERRRWERHERRELRHHRDYRYGEHNFDHDRGRDYYGY